MSRPGYGDGFSISRSYMIGASGLPALIAALGILSLLIFQLILAWWSNAHLLFILIISSLAGATLNGASAVRLNTTWFGTSTTKRVSGDTPSSRRTDPFDYPLCCSLQPALSPSTLSSTVRPSASVGNASPPCRWDTTSRGNSAVEGCGPVSPTNTSQYFLCRRFHRSRCPADFRYLFTSRSRYLNANRQSYSGCEPVQ